MRFRKAMFGFIRSGVFLSLFLVGSVGLAQAQSEEEPPAYLENKVAVLFNERYFETAVMQVLTEEKFHVIEPGLVRKVRQKHPVLIENALYHPQEQDVFAKLAPLFQAHILIVGTVLTETFQNDYGFISATTNAEVRVVALASGQVLASRTFSATRADVSVQAATDKSYRLILEGSDKRPGLAEWLIETLKQQPKLPDPPAPAPTSKPKTAEPIETSPTEPSEGEQQEDQEDVASSKADSTEITVTESSDSEQGDSSSSNEGQNTPLSQQEASHLNPASEGNPGSRGPSSSEPALSTQDVRIFALFSNTILWIVLAALAVACLVAIFAIRRPQSVTIRSERGDTVEVKRQYGGDPIESASQKKRCPQCGRIFPGTYTFCTDCEGQRLVPSD